MLSLLRRRGVGQGRLHSRERDVQNNGWCEATVYIHGRVQPVPQLVQAQRCQIERADR